jgi:electron transfer flavoprotein alpha subunit
MKILVIAEHDHNQIKPATLNAIGAAQKLNSPVDVVILGAQCATAASDAAKVTGVTKVYVCDDPRLINLIPEVMTPTLVQLIKDQNYTHVFTPASSYGKNLSPRVAALLDMQQISDVVAIDDQDTFQRPIYAGNAIATVQSKDPIKCLTIRSTAFHPAAATGGSAVTENIPYIEHQGPSAHFVGRELSVSARPELTTARIIISGGRGVGSAENFALLEKLADKLGAAVGASRAAVDAGYVPNDYQVGQTGKIVAPELYVAVGLSGAIQHLAGMKESKVIVAINKDPDAPIFSVADYGLVADLFTAVPELTEKL